MNEIKTVPYRTCIECSELLKLFKGIALHELVEERKGLPRCVVCIKLREISEAVKRVEK